MIDYNKEVDPNCSQEKLEERVRSHTKEKILRLKDHFIISKAGKERAKRLELEFVQALEVHFSHKIW
jgi:hypothetical protein